MSDSMRDERVAAANKFIEAIASRGRRFFEYVHHGNDGCRMRQVAQFKRDHNGKIWFLNEWKLKWIYVSRPGAWRGFHHGGTLHAVVSCLVRFIRTGETQIHGSNLDAKHWGYSADEMREIVAIGQECGVVKGGE